MIPFLTVSCCTSFNVLVFIFVLMEWSLLPNALRHFQIYCAPPNLRITRTWIYRLNFSQRTIFLDFRFFNELEITDSGPQLKVPPETCAQDFYVLKKSIDLSRVWTREPWTLRRARYPDISSRIYLKIIFWRICSNYP